MWRKIKEEKKNEVFTSWKKNAMMADRSGGVDRSISSMQREKEVEEAVKEKVEIRPR